jgi:hypothetical protein
MSIARNGSCRLHASKIVLVAAALVLSACSGAEQSANSSPLFDDQRFELRNGYVFFEGDINLGPVDKVLGQYQEYLNADRAARPLSPGLRPQSAGVFNRSARFQGESEQFPTFSGDAWPDHTVNFRFDAAFDRANTVKDEEFLDVVAHYRTRTSLRFVEVASTFTGDHILVKRNDTSAGGCWSYMGRNGGAQELQIGRPSCGFGSIIHEFGHAVGLIHEHQRPDRDDNVIVTTVGANWNKEGDDAVAMFGDYDLGSIMHYGTNQGGITNLDGSAIVTNRTALSDYDIRGIQVMYGAQFQPTLSALSRSSGRVDYFMRGNSGQVLHKGYNGSWVPSVTTFENLGGFILGAPEAVSRSSTTIDVFVRGGNRQLYTKTWNGSSWSANWTNISAGAALASDPVALTMGNRIDVFAKHDDNTVKQLTWNGTSWSSSWTNLGGPSIGPVEAVSWGTNRIDLFTVHHDRNLLHKWWNGTAWMPSQTGWETLGGYIVGKPTVVSWGANRLDIFTKTRAGAVTHKYWNGSSWLPSQTTANIIGNDAIGHPVAEAWGANRLDLFWQDGATGTLRRKVWAGSAWIQAGTTSENLGGGLVGAPEVVSWGSGRLDVLVRGESDAPFHKSFQTSWSPSTTGFTTHGSADSMTW